MFWSIGIMDYTTWLMIGVIIVIMRLGSSVGEELLVDWGKAWDLGGAAVTWVYDWVTWDGLRLLLFDAVSVEERRRWVDELGGYFREFDLEGVLDWEEGQF